MIKAVLFDLDGTLVDSSEGITKSVQYALEKYNIIENNLEKLKPFIGPPLHSSFMKYYDFDEKSAFEAVEVYRERYRPIGLFECSLYPNVEACLRILKEQGYRIALASSKPEEMCRQILEHFNITELFDEVAGSTLDGRIVTKIQVLEELFGRWNDISKDEMILVGDTIFDIEGANAAGISSIGVSFGFGDIEAMKEEGALCILSDLGELPMYLSNINI